MTVCGDCPHANEEQRGNATLYRHDGPQHSGSRCDGCFMPMFEHGAGGVCPTPTKPEAPVEQVVVLKPVAPVVPPRPRVQVCSSCSKAWNGQRVARAIEGMSCGTCGQSASYA